jgi:hypothetical protein
MLYSIYCRSHTFSFFSESSFKFIGLLAIEIFVAEKDKCEDNFLEILETFTQNTQTNKETMGTAVNN